MASVWLTDDEEDDHRPACPATREAVEEQEDFGEIGCPICGRPASEHPDVDVH